MSEDHPLKRPPEGAPQALLGALVAAARSEAPPPERAAAIAARTLAEPVAPAAGDDAFLPPSRPPAAAGLAGKALAIGLAGVVIAVLAIRSASLPQDRTPRTIPEGVDRGVAPSPATAPDEVDRAQLREAPSRAEATELATPIPVPRAPEPRAASKRGAPAGQSGAEAAPHRSEPTASPSDPHTTPPSAGATPEATAPPRADLAEEARLVGAAQRELTARPSHALELATEHAERFPSGVLAGARDVVRVQALARLGRRAEAEQIAAERRARDPRSPEVRRIDGILANPGGFR